MVNNCRTKKIIAQSSDRIVIRTTALKKWATNVSVVKINLPRVEMHVRALEGK